MRHGQGQEELLQVRPRCKRCPVVVQAAGEAGQGDRDGKRTCVLVDVTKQDLKAAAPLDAPR